MFGVSYYNPDEPRDRDGRWTGGGSSWRDNALPDPSRVGRADLLLGHGRFGAWQKGLIREFVLPTPAEAQRFSRLLTAWNAASDLDDETFRKLFIHGLDIAPATLRRLHQAAAGSAQAKTMGQMITASTPLTAAIKDIGADRWPAMLGGMQDRADAAMPKGSGSDNRSASRDHEDQPIDSEPGAPPVLLELAARGGGGRRRQGWFDPEDNEPPEIPNIAPRPRQTPDQQGPTDLPPQHSEPGMWPRWPSKRPVRLPRSPLTPRIEEIYAEEISEGHGFDEHGYQFGTRSEYKDKILRVLRSSRSLIRSLDEDRFAFYDEDSNTLVIVNPNDPDGGTMYKPDKGIAAFYSLE